MPHVCISTRDEAATRDSRPLSSAFVHRASSARLPCRDLISATCLHGLLLLLLLLFVLSPRKFFGKKDDVEGSFDDTRIIVRYVGEIGESLSKIR